MALMLPAAVLPGAINKPRPGPAWGEDKPCAPVLGEKARTVEIFVEQRGGPPGKGRIFDAGGGVANENFLDRPLQKISPRTKVPRKCANNVHSIKKQDQTQMKRKSMTTPKPYGAGIGSPGLEDRTKCQKIEQ